MYLAPTRALVAERVRDWTQRFGTVGITVAELTGDTEQRDISDAKKARVIVATPEKWDSATRRAGDEQKLLPRLGLVLIDEVHTLRVEGRGPRLEAVVARIKLHGNNARLVALSATVPNISDIADWIGSNQATGSGRGTAATTFNFDESYRPVPLKRLVYTYDKGETHGFKNTLDKYLMVCPSSFQTRSTQLQLTTFLTQDLIQEHGKQRPTLIFVPTRNATIICAETLAKEYEKIKNGPKRLPWPRPSSQAGSKFEHGKLSNVVKAGVAFHHAGLSAG